MADVMGAFLEGHRYGQAEKEHNQALEENKLRTMVLKHHLDALKIDDAVRARELALQNLQLMHGQPEADIPAEKNLPSTSNAGVMTGLPDVVSGMVRDRFNAVGGYEQGNANAGMPEGPGPETIAAPAAQETAPGRGRTLPMQIPGVEGMNIPPVSIRPQSMEDIVRASIASKMAEPYTLAPGAVRNIGGTTIGRGGPQYHSIGAGGLAETGADGKLNIVAPGRNGATGAPTVAARAAAERWKANQLAKLEKAFTDSQPIAVDAAGRPRLRLDKDAQEIRPMTQDDLVKQKAQIQQSYLQQIGAGAPGAGAPAASAPAAQPAAPATQPAQTFQQPDHPLKAADPATGMVYTFPNEAAARAYRQAKGIE